MSAAFGRCSTEGRGGFVTPVALWSAESKLTEAISNIATSVKPREIFRASAPVSPGSNVVRIKGCSSDKAFAS